jgi:hypothetical protein
VHARLMDKIAEPSRDKKEVRRHVRRRRKRAPKVATYMFSSLASTKKDKTPPVNADSKKGNTRIMAIGHFKSLPYIFKKVVGGGREGEKEQLSGLVSSCCCFFPFEP